MSIFHLAAVVALVVAASSAYAELTQKTEHVDRGKRGVAEKLSVSRDGALVYELYRLDRDRDGTYENYIEGFSVAGTLVFQFALAGTSRATVIRRESHGQVILSSDRDSWRPREIMIEMPDKTFEFFTLQRDGFYRPVDDTEKARIAGISKTGDDLLEAIQRGDAKGAVEAVETLQGTPPPRSPNREPHSTIKAVTPPAGAEDRASGARGSP